MEGKLTIYSKDASAKYQFQICLSHAAHTEVRELRSEDCFDVLWVRCEYVRLSQHLHKEGISAHSIEAFDHKIRRSLFSIRLHHVSDRVDAQGPLCWLY